MSIQVWKVSLTAQVGDAAFTEHELPKGFETLHVDVQYGIITLWVEVDTKATQIPVKFWVIGTGRDVPDGLRFIGTALMANGQLVAHVYM